MKKRGQRNILTFKIRKKVRMFMKYLTVYKNSLSTFFQYRLNLGLLIVSHLVSFSGLLYLWIAIYASGQAVGNYTLSEILVYYVILTVLHMTIAEGVSMAFLISDDIRNGIVANYLVKPFSHALEQCGRMMGQATINIAFLSPMIILLAWIGIGRGFVSLPDMSTTLAFVAMSGIGLLFYFLIYYLAALAAFWIHEGRASVYAMLLVSNLMNGSLIPLDLFPDWGQRLAMALPFRFLIFLPIQTFLGRVEEWTPLLLSAFAWVAILSLLIKLVWWKGIQKFEAVGR